jgi:hypothetical protein
MFGGSARVIKKNTEALVVACREISLEVKAEKLSTWSCFESRTQEKITTERWVINPLKCWNSSNIWVTILTD